MPDTPLLYLGPLRGVTDILFRNLYEEHFGKFDRLLTPFITTVKGTTVNPSHLRDVNPEMNDTVRTVPQIIGNDALDIINLSKAFHDLGYHEVNWNLGCPYPMVTKKKRGSGLLPYPDLLRTLLDQIMPAVPGKFSVKVRLGLESANELAKLADVFNAYPISEVMIHARTAEQMYEGVPDLDSFEKVYRCFTAAVIYNGDIVTYDDYLKVKQRFPGITRWMIGRGVVKNPLIIESIRTDRHLVDMKRIEKFHDNLYRVYKERMHGPGHLLGKMKEFWFYLSWGFADQEKLLKKIQKTNKVDQYECLIKTLFDTVDHQIT